MAAGRVVADWVDPSTKNTLDDLASGSLAGDEYAASARALGVAVASRYLQTTKTPDRFHVVTAVEDFDNFTAGIVRRLEGNGSLVRYSCVWPQRQIVNDETGREVSPIFQAFRQEQWETPYQMIFAVSNIGTIARIKSCIVHAAIDEALNNGDFLDILCGSHHEDAMPRLRAALPPSLREQVRIFSPARDAKIGKDGFSEPGVGGNPAVLSGVGIGMDRERFIPQTIVNDFRLAAKGLGI